MSRCLYNSSLTEFVRIADNVIFGELCDKYHGEALTTTREAWKGEISIMKDALSKISGKDGQIIFEYDISRLGKRIDVVLPSFIVILIIATLIRNLLKYAGVKAFLDGIRPCIVGLILATAITMFRMQALS